MTDDDPEEDGFITDPKDLPPKRDQYHWWENGKHIPALPPKREKLKPKYVPVVPQADRLEESEWR